MFINDGRANHRHICVTTAAVTIPETHSHVLFGSIPIAICVCHLQLRSAACSKHRRASARNAVTRRHLTRHDALEWYSAGEPLNHPNPHLIWQRINCIGRRRCNEVVARVSFYCGIKSDYTSARCLAPCGGSSCHNYCTRRGSIPISGSLSFG